MGATGVGFGLVSGVLQPANTASDNAVVAAATMLRLMENIELFVTHRDATNKRAKMGRDGAHATSPPAQQWAEQMTPTA